MGTITPLNPPHKIVGRECPCCGHLLTQMQVEHARRDFGCPKCGTSFRFFQPVDLKSTGFFDDPDLNPPA